jgi:hypothetical protein
MADSYAKLDQAIKELVEAYAELEEDATEKHGEDEEAFGSAIVEALETSIEGAMEEYDISSGAFASLLSVMTEALEQIDPAAFEGGSEEEEDDDSDDDVDYDDDSDYDEDDGDDYEDDDESSDDEEDDD